MAKQILLWSHDSRTNRNQTRKTIIIFVSPQQWECHYDSCRPTVIGGSFPNPPVHPMTATVALATQNAAFHIKELNLSVDSKRCMYPWVRAAAYIYNLQEMISVDWIQLKHIV